MRPIFTVDKPGNYVAQLIVNDGKLSSAPATVTITTQNSPPVANAGPDQSVARGAMVHLDGSGSTDPDGDQLTFSWSITSKPAGSTAVLIGPTSMAPTFVVDKSGVYLSLIHI